MPIPQPRTNSQRIRELEREAFSRKKNSKDIEIGIEELRAKVHALELHIQKIEEKMNGKKDESSSLN